MKKNYIVDDYLYNQPSPLRQDSRFQIKQCLKVPYKQNHHKLPIVILPDHRLLVFTQLPLYSKIYHHLISICEPIYRPKFVHEYKITKFSLYTAMVLHYTGDEIIQILNTISKNRDFPLSLAKEIKQYMKYAGQVRFHLIQDRYYLYTNKQIGSLLRNFVQHMGQITIQQQQKYHLNQIHEQLEQQQQEEENMINNIHNQNSQMEFDYIQESYNQFQAGQENRNFKKKKKQKKSVKKNTKKLEKYLIKGDYFEVTKFLIEKNIPIVQEFDFMNSPDCKSISMEMISDLQLRYYQQRALKNVFIEGLARSGIIILPCGAGKSLVAISLIQRIKKNSVIFCQSQVSAEQWRSQLLKWTTIQRDKIVILSPKLRDKNPKKLTQCSVLITTYAMVSMKRVVQNKFLEQSQKISWGVCIADQVHKLPAETFQLVLQKYKFYLKIGLTATPYREDQKINNLFFMIGPKLYEQNWLDLVEQGCLAKPYCVQILCDMPKSFSDIYKKTSSSDLIHTANPQKFRVLQYLLKKHSYCHDKILVFCDRPKIIEYYAKLLKMPFIHGEVSQQERVKIYNLFKTTKDINILFLSRVGDTAIDLPCANVGIQLGMHYKSRRQQVQRMGRIMRAKDNPNNEFNAFFYTLVSLNTKEVEYSRKRQQCLVDQGFQYQIKLGKQLDYKGMNIIQIKEKQFLLKLLSEHEEGDKYLAQLDREDKSNISLQNKKRQIVQVDMQKQMEQYYYQEVQSD